MEFLNPSLNPASLYIIQWPLAEPAFFRLFSIFYLGLGWMAVLTVPPMLDQMNNNCFKWIAIGGGFYTFGVLFYVWEKLPFSHSIWHLFVIAGSVGHFIAMLYAFS